MLQSWLLARVLRQAAQLLMREVNPVDLLLIQEELNLAVLLHQHLFHRAEVSPEADAVILADSNNNVTNQLNIVYKTDL